MTSFVFECVCVFSLKQNKIIHVEFQSHRSVHAPYLLPATTMANANWISLVAKEEAESDMAPIHPIRATLFTFRYLRIGGMKGAEE